MFHKGKAKAQPEMMPIEILRETGMSLTEQRKQPAWFIDLLMTDIRIKRQVENAEIKRANRGRK
jgi:hypothetical protein